MKMFCPSCGSPDIFELGIEKGESWYLCYACKRTWGDYCPEIPLDEFAEELRNQGFPLDAERVASGERASECGE